MKKKLIWIAGLSVILASTVTFADSKGAGKCPVAKKMATCPVTRATTSAYSNETIDAVRKAELSFYKETEALTGKISALRADLFNALTGENPEREKALGIQNEITQLTGEFDNKKIDFIIDTMEAEPASALYFKHHYSLYSSKDRANKRTSCKKAKASCPYPKSQAQ